MIATTIWGGLGNQMFMYAAARAMSLRNHTELGLNLKQGFKDDYKFQRHLELQHFQMELPEADVDSFNIPLGKLFRKISKMVGFNILKPSSKVLNQTENVEDLLTYKRKNVFLNGYWASEEYFVDFKEIIKKDFTIRGKELRKEVFEELRYMHSLGNNLIMMGVRRYQECKDPSYIPQGGLTADKEYYKKAMDYIASKVDDPVFCVFSQAHDWVRENVDDGKYKMYYVQSKTGENSAIEDLYLMNHCDHYIISNSTYYWWGAYLSKNDKRIVVCPKANRPHANCKDWIEISK